MDDLLARLDRCARFGMKPGLETITTLLRKMGNPQDSVGGVVHVAGTNGKGATCAMLESAFLAAGFRTGRYTSPHLINVTERFFFGGKAIDMARLECAAATVPETDGITYFELLTATAFALYRTMDTERLVLETGLGGRLDATNVVRRPLACVITRIGLDHCDVLGNAIAEIAAEKGGIIKPGVKVILGAMPDEARMVLTGIAAERGAPCVYAPDVVVDSDIPKDFALQGKFNRENAITAIAALRELGIDEESIALGLRTVFWPGRFQRVGNFIVDGAHNPPAMRALVESLRDGVKRVVICGFCADKDVRENISILHEVADVAYAVKTNNPRSLPAAELSTMMRAAGFAAEPCDSLRDAIAKCGERNAIICGSLFLVGEALVTLNAINGANATFTPNETISCIDMENMV